jgi:crossover junction endonuclease EME1
MPEIISLLSSPLTSQPKQRHGQPRRSPSPTLDRDIIKFDSDDFDFTGLSGDLDFRISQPEKKRKLSPNEAALPQKPAKLQVYTISDDEDLPLPHASIGKSGEGVEYHWDGLLSDPIGLSSSAPEPRDTNKGKATISVLSDDLPEDVMALGESFSLSQPTVTGNGRMHLSERTAHLLAGLNTKQSAKRSKIYSHAATKDKTDVHTYVENIFSSSPVSMGPSKSVEPSKQTGAANEARARERAIAKAAKDKTREEEKERKRFAKAQKAKEKQEAADIAQVNKSKTDKKVSVTEMMVELSRSLQGTSVGNQVVEYMKHLEVDTTFFEEEIDLGQDDQVDETYGSLVKWRRKVKAKYNEDAGHWEPIAELRIENEPHILVHLTASDFAGLVTVRSRTGRQESGMSEEAMMRNIDQHVSNLRRKYKGCKPIYLIEGLESFLRKNKNVKNRAYTAAVLSQLPASEPSAPPASSQARRRNKTKNSSTTPDYTFMDADLAESLLLHLQINHSVLIHHTTSPSDTASWIRTFTEHISTIPYRHERMALNDAGAAFCMDVGQVKTGDDAHDTYVKMLQEVQRVTPAMAYGIANRYPNVRALVKAFREDGQLVLEDVRKGANRDGAVTNSRLGPAVSKRLYKLFMGRNEWSTDGIA